MPLAEVIPEELHLLMEAASLHTERMEYDQAQEIYEGVLALRPGNETVLLAMASLAFRRGDAKRATDEVRQVLKQSPDSGLAHAYLGEILQGEGKDDEAKAALEKAIELEPKGPAGEMAKAILAAVEAGASYKFNPDKVK